jgi:hypothetical protein
MQIPMSKRSMQALVPVVLSQVFARPSFDGLDIDAVNRTPWHKTAADTVIEVGLLTAHGHRAVAPIHRGTAM